MFVNNKTSKYYKEIQLSDILTIENATTPYDSGNFYFEIRVITNNKKIYLNNLGPMHCFELKTNNLEYYVGSDEHNSSADINIENISNWSEEEKNWKIIIQQALMPLPSNASSMNLINYIEAKINN